MSKTKSPQEKKRLSYAKDHYTRGGESARGWRTSKRIKKANARRRFRRATNALTHGLDVASAEESVVPKKKQSIRQPEVHDWGTIRLDDFVASRKRVKDRKVRAR